MGREPIKKPKQEIKIEVKAEEKAEVKKEIPVQKKSISISGLSIGDILNSNSSQTQQQTQEVEQLNIDDNSQDKINKAKQSFIETLSKKRPRLGIAFGEMSVEGNTIKIEVLSEALKEEIQRNQSEILMLLAKISGVEGQILLEIEVKEQIENFIPIKADDKLKFLVEKNPLLTSLRKAIDLDFE